MAGGCHGAGVVAQGAIRAFAIRARRATGDAPGAPPNTPATPTGGFLAARAGATIGRHTPLTRPGSATTPSPLNQFWTRCRTPSIRRHRSAGADPGTGRPDPETDQNPGVAWARARPLAGLDDHGMSSPPPPPVN